MARVLAAALLLVPLLMWLNGHGERASERLFTESGRPRVAREATVSLWDEDKRVARLAAGSITETAPHRYSLDGIEDAVFYRRYDPYVDMSAPGAEWDDRRETLRFFGPFVATTRDDIRLETTTALWTRRSKILLLPEDVTVTTEDVTMDGRLLVFATEEDRFVLLGPWSARLVSGRDAPEIRDGAASYDTEEAVLHARRIPPEVTGWDPAIQTARREPYFREHVMGTGPIRVQPRVVSGEWVIRADDVVVEARRGVARMEGDLSLEDEGQKTLAAEGAEYWWDPGYLTLEGKVDWRDEGRVATADRGFVDRREDLVRLEGGVVLSFPEPVLEDGDSPVLAAERLEVLDEPDRFVATGGFAWHEPPTVVSARELVYHPDDDRLAVEGDVVYDREDTMVMAPSLRLSPERARFVGTGRVAAGPLEAIATEITVDRDTEGVSMRGVEGTLDGRPLSAAQADRADPDGPWRLRDARLEAGDGLRVEGGEVVADPDASTGTATRDALIAAGEVVVRGATISFGWDPGTATCSSSCRFGDGTWEGPVDGLTARGEEDFEAGAFSLGREGWLDAEGEVTLRGASLTARGTDWGLDAPAIDHPDWTVEGEVGTLPADGTSLLILGSVVVTDADGRRAVGERWTWEEESDEVVLEGDPRIEGEDDVMEVARLVRVDGDWRGAGPVSWRHSKDGRETLMTADSVREVRGGYRFLGPVEMRHDEVSVRAAEARVRTEAGLILFSGAVEVVLENGTRAEGDEFVFDLDTGTGVLQGSTGGEIVVD